MKKLILKIATITSFVGLIGLFVAFRAGYFGFGSNPLPMSPNGGVINSQTNDSVPSKDSLLLQRAIISSSKSIVIKDFNIERDPAERDSMIEYLKEQGFIFRNETQRKQDSIFKLLTTDSITKKKIIFSGSKSGPIIQREDMIKLAKDSTYADSLQNEHNE